MRRESSASSRRGLCAGALPSECGFHWLGALARLDAARNLSAALNLDLLVAHVAGNTPGRANDESLADLERALKSPDHFGVDDGGCSREQASGGDLQFLARDFGADLSFDGKAVAIFDLAGNDKPFADDERAIR